MALSGLDIYKLLPKTNCKECSFATCLAFAMQLAQKKASLDKCPYVSEGSRGLLESAAQPPMKLVTIGKGQGALEIGNETVMFRHEQKFYHRPGVGFLLEDEQGDEELRRRIAKINKLAFERVGQTIKVDLVAIKNASLKKERFLEVVKMAMEDTDLNMLLISRNIDALKEASQIARDRRPIIMAGSQDALDGLIAISKENRLPLVVSGRSLEDLAELTQKANALGVDEMVLYFEDETISGRVQKFTLARRSALKKNVRHLGYPLIAFTLQEDPYLELEEAVSYVARYANLIIIRNIDKDFVLPLLVARQDIYTDPQKPVQVEPRVYEIGHVTRTSPVLVTTNFSITYFTVAGEVETSKVPSYLVSCDAEGMSVLTAWAAEKFTAESIADMINKCKVSDMVSHRKVIIPGYVSVLSGRLRELSGWDVLVGPREASGIPEFLRGWK